MVVGIYFLLFFFFYVQQPKFNFLCFLSLMHLLPKDVHYFEKPKLLSFGNKNVNVCTGLCFCSGGDIHTSLQTFLFTDRKFRHVGWQPHPYPFKHQILLGVYTNKKRLNLHINLVKNFLIFMNLYSKKFYQVKRYNLI